MDGPASYLGPDPVWVVLVLAAVFGIIVLVGRSKNGLGDWPKVIGGALVVVGIAAFVIDLLRLAS